MVSESYESYLTRYWLSWYSLTITVPACIFLYPKIDWEVTWLRLLLHIPPRDPEDFIWIYLLIILILMVAALFNIAKYHWLFHPYFIYRRAIRKILRLKRQTIRAMKREARRAAIQGWWHGI